MMNASGPWFTITFGFLLVTLGLPIAAFIPETRSAAVVKRAEAARKDAERYLHIKERGSCLDLRPILRSTWQKLSLINRTLFLGNPTVGILLFSTVFITLGKSVIIMLLQYVTKRFKWSWAKVSNHFFMALQVFIIFTQLTPWFYFGSGWSTHRDKECNQHEPYSRCVTLTEPVHVEDWHDTSH